MTPKFRAWDKNNKEITINDTKGIFDIITKVNGNGGEIKSSKSSVVEDSNEKVKFTFTADTGYMIDEVLVNGVETPVTNNELELSINKNTTVTLYPICK